MALKTNYWIFGILSLALFGLIGYQLLHFKEVDIQTTTTPPSTIASPPLTVQVDRSFSQPVTQRIGTNISSQKPEEADYTNQGLVDLLKKLRPSWLRNEGSYSIADFLELSSKVQANPWLIVPTTLSDEELTDFGKFLAEHGDQSRFSQVTVEFGNKTIADHSFPLIAAAAGQNVNLHPTLSKGHEELVAEAKSASALAQSLMKEMFVNDLPEYISLSDIGDDKRLSSNGLVIEMLNQIIGGSLHPVKGTEPANLTLAAFRTSSTWAAALVSAQAVPTEVAIAFPEDGRALPTHAYSLSNDEIVKTAIQTDQRTITCIVPSNGLLVLTSDAVLGTTP
jgi:hypothetical protein